MKKLKLLVVLMMLSLATIAQTKTKTLLVDETELIMLKSSFRVETCNDQVFKLVLDKFKKEGFKYTVSIKKDRAGYYSLYSIPFKMAELDIVKEFFEQIK